EIALIAALQEAFGLGEAGDGADVLVTTVAVRRALAAVPAAAGVAAELTAALTIPAATEALTGNAVVVAAMASSPADQARNGKQETAPTAAASAAEGDFRELRLGGDASS
ncbi:unnamed protein product, partial [Phaeothamnion confervicola]